MANSNLFQFRQSYQRNLVDIFAQISFAALGVPTLVAGKGVSSIERVSAGLFNIHLREPFGGVMHVQQMPLLASGAPAAAQMVVRSVSNINTLSDPQIQVEFLDAAGAAIDPASGEQVLMQIILKNTTA